MDGMHRTLAAVAGLLVIPALTGCGGADDPERFDALYDEVVAAMDNADFDSEPGGADDLEAAFGWDRYSPFAVAEYADEDGMVLCFVNEDQDTYLFTSEGANGDVYLGDGTCSDDVDDAKVVISEADGAVSKGAEMVPSAAKYLAESNEPFLAPLTNRR